MKRIFNISIICFVVLTFFTLKNGYSENFFNSETHPLDRELWIVTQNPKLAKKRLEQIETIIDEKLQEIGDKQQSTDERDYLLFLSRKYLEQKQYIKY